MTHTPTPTPTSSGVVVALVRVCPSPLASCQGIPASRRIHGLSMPRIDARLQSIDCFRVCDPFADTYRLLGYTGGGDAYGSGGGGGGEDGSGAHLLFLPLSIL